LTLSPLNILLVVAWAVSSVALIVLILMHSGKGTGVSDMIASSMYNAAAGSATWEKNLDTLTIIFGLVFAVTIFAMMLVFPQGSFA
jgi:preprotein translocase subunit SecG